MSSSRLCHDEPHMVHIDTLYCHQTQTIQTVGGGGGGGVGGWVYVNEICMHGS